MPCTNDRSVAYLRTCSRWYCAEIITEVRELTIMAAIRATGLNWTFGHVWKPLQILAINAIAN